MKTVIAHIEETIVQDFEFQIEDDENEVEAAIKKYRAGELILEDAEVQFRQVETEIKGNPYSASGWIEF